MTSPVAAWITQVTTQWEALTPPTRTGVTYHSIANRVAHAGAAGDRSFYPLPSDSSEAVAEAGVTATQVWWSQPFLLRLSQAGMSRGAMAAAILNETALLARSVMKTSSWPASVLDAIYDGHSADYDGDEQADVLVSLNFRVLTSETD